MSTADILAIALGANALAANAALVYVVRRVSPWPKPPAPQSQGPGSSRRRGTADVPAAEEKVPAPNGSAPAGSGT